MSNINSYIEEEPIDLQLDQISVIQEELHDLAVESAMLAEDDSLTKMISDSNLLEPYLNGATISKATIATLRIGMEDMDLSMYDKHMYEGHAMAAEASVVESIQKYSKNVWEYIRKVYKSIVLLMKKTWSAILKLYSKIAHGTEKITKELNKGEGTIELNDENVQALKKALKKVIKVTTGYDGNVALDKKHGLIGRLQVHKFPEPILRAVLGHIPVLNKKFKKFKIGKVLSPNDYKALLAFYTKNMYLVNNSGKYETLFFKVVDDSIRKMQVTLPPIAASLITDNFVISTPDRESTITILENKRVETVTLGAGRTYTYRGIDVDIGDNVREDYDLDDDAVRNIVSFGREVIDGRVIYKSLGDNACDAAIAEALKDVRRTADYLSDVLVTSAISLELHIAKYMEALKALSTDLRNDSPIPVIDSTQIGQMAFRQILNDSGDLMMTVNKMYSTYTKSAISAFAGYFHLVHTLALSDK